VRGRDVILGLPWSSWLLLILAVGLGLALSLTFYLIHRGDPSATDQDDGADPREPA
jgi:hypothetical protein